MRRFLTVFLLAPLWLFSSISVHAEESFVVSDIRVQGLQRVSAASVFTSVPINVGDTVDQAAISNAIRSLFRSGNYDDVEIGRDGTVLVVAVVERPSISEIVLEGNKAIKSEALLEGLKGAGLAEGQVFKRSTLETMKLELTRQYVSQGRYDAGIDTEVVSLPRNRVAVNINIDEGNTAAIKHINIVGNKDFSEEELLDLVELSTTGFWSWITSDDKYAKEALAGDLETLKSFYLDRGYLTFAIDSTQVTVTPDRKAVYITINIKEGEVYTVDKVDLSGDLVVKEEQLWPFVLIQSGQTFSQTAVTNSEEWLTKRLGNDGYNFAKVETITDIDQENQTVNLKFFIDPGKRTYVRRIEFDGNSKTADEVLRREMRQMEGAPASSSRIEQSRIRLDRLGYFKDAKVETLEVPGSDDQIDIKYKVEEQPSGSIGASIGYSQDSGIIFGANVQQDNVLGTGKQVGIGLNKSRYMTNVRFSYTNPYYTEDGVSRGFSVFYRKADLSEINVSNYTTNTLGTSMNFSYPIKETERVGYSFTYTNTEIEAGDFAVQEIFASPRADSDFINHYYDSEFAGNVNGVSTYAQAELPKTFDPVANADLLTPPTQPGFIDLYGNEFNDFTFTTSWSQSTLNRGRMATRGASQSLALEVTIPGSDLEFYKLTYTGQVFLPITNNWIVRLRGDLGYGDGFGDVEELPFFQNFYSGGFGSVRGFKSNTLGPRSTPALRYDRGQAVVAVCSQTDVDNSVSNCSVVGQAKQLDDKFSYIASDGSFNASSVDNKPDPFGGNLLVEASVELLFPLPFIKDQSSIRSAFYFDVGNVFSTDCRATQVNCTNFDMDELRYSVGVGMTWITGFGPLTFSYSKPMNESEYDETENFQFSLGRSF
ncbi:outer membrane protein assembly factor BamA [Dasania sp. GY-MA-18]|uniref:Outer membrane protein assembly factor BamA n=1 Tax=Dasania phycosphaerae TaxID=2950436 RepID=A0A9J6RPY4_9GAMM|nr:MULTISPECIES: outer membrane protein assembly factor BamA [Dasania]MCR8923976.1 outer membrane protein assembly factor BamA [Dasania sp. GY-MA-18]MCZ0866410.1 outer membrane protein assembly factor BamA [Dasania phycosphaerae]MCZ0870134.1 outer membrane protein assembly factor BamA [Dasania phycosphaerae]